MITPDEAKERLAAATAEPPTALDDSQVETIVDKCLAKGERDVPLYLNELSQDDARARARLFVEKYQAGGWRILCANGRMIMSPASEWVEPVAAAHTVDGDDEPVAAAAFNPAPTSPYRSAAVVDCDAADPVLAPPWRNNTQLLGIALSCASIACAIAALALSRL